jgi:hypothetical protein
VGVGASLIAWKCPKSLYGGGGGWVVEVESELSDRVWM